jgi:hypothetical protein
VNLTELSHGLLEAEDSDFLEGADPVLVTVAQEVRNLAAGLGGGTWDATDYWMVMEMVRRHVDGAWGPDTLDVVGDPLLRMHTPSDRGPHLDTLAERLTRGWRLFDPGDRTRLHDRAEEAGRTPEEEKVHLAHLGLLEAMADVNRPQTLRVGSTWITDPETGEKATIIPSEALGWITLSATWYPARAKGAATAALRDEAWPDTPSADDPLDLATVLDDALILHSIAPDPLTDLLFREHKDRIRTKIDTEALTPAEGDLLRAYLESGDWSGAGETLGLQPGTLRQRKRRLLAKLRDSGGGL